MNHLDSLEAESIYIIRETAASFKAPVFLYSVGKDSSVILHLIRKAFYPAEIPFPLMHIDTTWKFREMIQFRDETVRSLGLKLITYTNPQGLADNINPVDHDSAFYTDIMKTQALRQALDKYQFDAAIGGARRDEEKSRAKERIFSIRSKNYRWDPKRQRPELWHNYNTCMTKEETMRVFPLSNWTELDVWSYIHRENIPVVPLYFAKVRPAVLHNGLRIMVDDERLPASKENIENVMIRFRTLGCYPLTGAVESQALTVSEIIDELRNSDQSEREGRAIDHDQAGSMELKKKEGYF